MPVRRTYASYDDGCAAAHALDLVGERWALIVARELMLGPKRFSDLRRGMVGASPAMLTQRLREMTDAGIVERRTGEHGVELYALTEWGLGLGPVLQALGAWAVQSPTMPHGNHIGPETAVLSMRTLHDGVAAGDLDLRLQLVLDDVPVAVETAGGLDARRGEVDEPRATVRTSPTHWAQVLYYGRTVDDAISAGDLSLEGDRAELDAYLALFPRLAPQPRDS